MAPDYELIGKRIKKERLKHKLTQEDMADKIDTSVAFYSRVETGKSPINLKRIVQIADLLGVSAGYFITGTNEGKDDYLNYEFKEVLSKCTPEQQKFIYRVAELVAEKLW